MSLRRLFPAAIACALFCSAHAGEASLAAGRVGATLEAAKAN